MSNELEFKKKRIIKLGEGNQRSYNELLEASNGMMQMDTSDMRRELMFDFMVEIGLITEDQRYDFEIKFHEKVETALNDAWTQLREGEKAASALSVVKKPKGLVDQYGRPLS